MSSAYSPWICRCGKFNRDNLCNKKDKCLNPIEIIVRPKDNLAKLIASLPTKEETRCPIILYLKPGKYKAPKGISLVDDESDVADLSIIGDTNPLAGVGFMNKGMYMFPPLNPSFNLAPEVGTGGIYTITKSMPDRLTVTTGPLGANPTPSVDPNFSCVCKGTKVKMTDVDGNLHTFTVKWGNGNTIAFFQNILFDIEEGVAFSFVPKVEICSGAFSRIISVENLKVQGIHINQAVGQRLLLGARPTKLNFQNNLTSATTILLMTARESYNNQPNTFCGVTVYLPISEPNFLMSTVLGKTSRVVFDTAKRGVWNSAQVSAGRLIAGNGAPLSTCYSRIFNVRGGGTAVGLLGIDGAVIRFPGGWVRNCDIGVKLENSSKIVTEIPPSLIPFQVRNCTTGLFMNRNCLCANRGSKAAGSFSGNGTDLDIDGVTDTLGGGTILDGVFQPRNSYILFDP